MTVRTASGGKTGAPVASNDATGASAGQPATIGQRLRVRVLTAVVAILTALPEGPIDALAEAAGELWYRVAPGRRDRARRNLRRVVGHLAAEGLGGPRVRAAAADERALERLVRAAFRQAVRYYLDMARLPGLSPAHLDTHLIVETPDVVADAFREPGPMIFVAMHFGAVEYPAFFAVARTGQRVVAPMETLDDPALQAWIAETRSSAGVDVLPLRDARRPLLAALAAGRAVGIVADRNVAGGTADVEYFGAPAPLPMGPAFLAVEAGLPIWLAAVRRAGGGRYRGQLRRIDIPAEGSRRARVAGTMAGLARAMESAIAAAPEQWWSVFAPIWPDLDPEARTGTGRLEPKARAGADPARPGVEDVRDTPGGAA